MPLVADVHAAGSPKSFQGGDDHVVFGITNRGRDVQELVIVAGKWLDDHTIAMGTTRACDFEMNPDLIVCGPVYSGQHMNFTIRAFPDAPGTFEYDVRFFSREHGRLVPILDGSGKQPVIRLQEAVDPQGRQVQGYVPQPSPTP